jgi:hypothetical protein
LCSIKQKKKESVEEYYMISSYGCAVIPQQLNDIYFGEVLWEGLRTKVKMDVISMLQGTLVGNRRICHNYGRGIVNKTK